MKNLKSWLWIVLTLAFVLLIVWGVKSGDLDLIRMESSTL